MEDWNNGMMECWNYWNSGLWVALAFAASPSPRGSSIPLPHHSIHHSTSFIIPLFHYSVIPFPRLQFL